MKMSFSSDDSTTAMRRWERWAESLRVHDRILAAGHPGIVTDVTDDFVFVCIEGRVGSFAWSDVDAPPS